MMGLRACLVAVAAVLAFAALAIEPPQDPPASQPQAPKPAQDEPAPEAGEAPAEPPPQRFNPTEKVRADFPVSFPIDI